MPENAQTDQCGFPAIEGEQECGAAHVIFKCADQGQYWAYGIEQANGQCPFSIPAECFCGSYTAPRLASGHEEEIVVRFAARAELARLTVVVYGYGYTTDSMKLLGSGITNNPAPVLVNIDGLSPNLILRVNSPSWPTFRRVLSISCSPASVSISLDAHCLAAAFIDGNATETGDRPSMLTKTGAGLLVIPLPSSFILSVVYPYPYTTTVNLASSARAAQRTTISSS